MEFDRFKYAEEHAHQLDRDGKRFVFTNDPDATYDEFGETYKMSFYTVEEVDG